LQKITTFAPNIEITLEANPTSVEIKKFKQLKAVGINRISIGVQSFKDENLKFLGREHSSNEAIKALEIAKNTFDRYTFDLIYVLPDQSLYDWDDELATAKKYSGDHISLYQLTIEKGTRFFSLFNKGDIKLPDSDHAASLYELTDRSLADCGLYSYEVSNYAKAGKESVHNLNYWRYGSYLGIGPGAHSRIKEEKKIFAMVTEYNPDAWLKKVFENGVGIKTKDLLSDEQIYREKIMMGLRLYEGLLITAVTNLDKIKQMQDLGLLEPNRSKVRCTKKGMLLLDSIIKELLT
jgi:putative oxygen-independent coproporphyrinogen III oxidase